HLYSLSPSPLCQNVRESGKSFSGTEGTLIPRAASGMIFPICHGLDGSGRQDDEHADSHGATFPRLASLAIAPQLPRVDSVSLVPCTFPGYGHPADSDPGVVHPAAPDHSGDASLSVSVVLPLRAGRGALRRDSAGDARPRRVGGPLPSGSALPRQASAPL